MRLRGGVDWIRSRTDLVGSLLLVSAAMLVGAAIVADGALGRALNGVGAVCWFVAIPLLWHAARREAAPAWIWLLCLGLSGSIAFVVRPSDIWLATATFAAAGGCMGWVAVSRPPLWGALLAALYLPAHIGAAVVKVTVRELSGGSASIRTDPPPTAAVVPVLIVVVALGSAWIVGTWRTSRNVPSSALSRSGNAANSQLG